MYFIAVKSILKKIFINHQIEVSRYMSDEKLCNCEQQTNYLLIDYHNKLSQISNNSFLRGSEK